MITAALTFAAGIIAFLFYETKRADAKRDDPRNQNAKRYTQIDQDIAKGQSLVATIHASDDLDELDRLQNASKSGGK